MAVQVALIEHRTGALGAMDLRVLAVPLYDDIGGAVDVEVGGHFTSAVPRKPISSVTLEQILAEPRHASSRPGSLYMG